MYRKLFLVFTLLFSFTIMISAQDGGHFKNLKVLPKDISKENLKNVMKGFTAALGVRCSFCHVGEEGKPLDTYDFSSDRKTSKQKARIMMKMTHDINSVYLAKLSEFSNNIEKVECVTCHRGAKEPRKLEDVMLYTIKKKGVDQAVKTYHELRDKYYGGFTYDFRDHTLVSVIQGLVDDKNFDAALKMGELNLKMYPNSGVAHFGMGQAYEAKGDNANAVIEYKEAVKLMPGAARFLDKKIEKLEGK